ncbi:MAG TPA: hypothetical protein VLI46_04410 [Ramlibacter sp.]|nr:hypothetical protein [Ramlibacter sp.]
MTQELFRDDSYLKECTAAIVRVGEAGIVLDRTVKSATTRRVVLGFA